MRAKRKLLSHARHGYWEQRSTFASALCIILSFIDLFGEKSSFTLRKDNSVTEQGTLSSYTGLKSFLLFQKL